MGAYARWWVPLLLVVSLYVGVDAASALEPGDIVAADPAGVRVLRIDPDTGAGSVIASGGNLVEPWAAVVAADTGLVYVADRGAGAAGAVIEVDPDAYDGGNPGANQQVIASGGELDDPAGIVWEEAGRLLVADAGAAGGVIRVTIDDGAQSRIATVVGATGIALRGGLVYVSTPSTNAIFRIDASQQPTEVLSISSTGFFSTLGGLAVEADGQLIVADIDGEIVRVDPDQVDSMFPDANQSLVSDDVQLAEPRGVAVALDGTIFVSDSGAGNEAVFEVDPDTGVATPLTSSPGGIGSAVGLSVARRGLSDGEIVVANTGSFASDGRVVVVEPGTGDQRLLASIPSVKGIAIESSTRLVVSAGGGGATPSVIRLDLATGEQRTVSMSQELNLAEDILVAPDGTLYVGESSNLTFDPVSMDLADVGIVEVDPVTGAQTIEAFDQDFRVLALTQDPANGDFITASTNSGFDSFTISRVAGNTRTILATDDLLETPRGVVVDADAGLIYVADSSEILSLPLAGGAQTSVSSSSVFGSGGLAMDGDGTLLVTVGSSFVGRVLRVDPSDGSAVQVTDGGFLKGPRGIAVYRVPEPSVGAGAMAALVTLAGLVRLRRSPRVPRGA